MRPEHLSHLFFFFFKKKKKIIYIFFIFIKINLYQTTLPYPTDPTGPTVTEKPDSQSIPRLSHRDTLSNPINFQHQPTMASLHPSWLSALNSINTISPSKPAVFPSTILNKTHSLKPLKLSSSVNPSNAESSEPISPSSPETTPEPVPGAIDPVKLAFEKAKAYKKEAKSKQVSKIEQNPVEDSGTKEVPVSVKVAMERAKEYKKNKGVVGGGKNGGEIDTVSGIILESYVFETERDLQISFYFIVDWLPYAMK